MGGIGDMTPEEAAALEASGAAGVQAQQEAAAAANVEGSPSKVVPPGSLTEEELLSRGVALASTLTSPGGPWHGLPPDAASNPDSEAWAENQRWAVVESGRSGSWLIVTSDGAAVEPEHAANVIGYAQASEMSQATLKNLDPVASEAKALELGNGVAWGDLDPNLFVAPGPWQG